MDIRKQERIQEIYNRNSDMVYRICYLYLKNEQDAYDVTHETFIRLILREPEFSSREAERAWLIRVAVNCCRDMLKSWWRSNWNGREAMEDQQSQGITEKGAGRGCIVISEKRWNRSD